MGEGACVPVGAGGLGGYTHQRVNQLVNRLVRGEAHDSRNRKHRQTHPGVAGGWTPLCRFDSCRRVFTGSRGRGGSRGFTRGRGRGKGEGTVGVERWIKKKKDAEYNKNQYMGRVVTVSGSGPSPPGRSTRPEKVRHARKTGARAAHPQQSSSSFGTHAGKATS